MDSNAISNLVNLIENGPKFKKPFAIKELSEIEGFQFTDLFLKYLSDKDWHVRLEAARALAITKGPEALEYLTPLLNDKAYGVRMDVKEIIKQYCSN